MLTTTLTTLFFSALALSAAFPVTERSAGSVRYCSKPNICAEMPVKLAKCQTFAAPGVPILIFDAGLKCQVFQQGSCEKQFFSRMLQVDNVKGAFDATTDPRAIRNQVTSVGSFMC